MPFFYDIIKNLTPRPKTCKVDQQSNVCSVEDFRTIIENERARVDRSGHCFSVVSFTLGTSKENVQLNNSFLEVLKKRLRSTDEIGFIDEDHIGVLLHNTPPDAASCFTDHIRGKVESEILQLNYEIFAYPIDPKSLGNNNSNTQEYRDNIKHDKKDGRNALWNSDITNSVISGSEKTSFHATQDARSNPIKYTKDICPLVYQKIPAWKRFIDITGATFGIVLLSPLFLLIAILIKVMSPGPVFFKQERIGCNGKSFTFWKFRTMEHKIDTTKHQKYLAKLINESNDKPMAKLDNELGLVPFGNILRKSCLDELPQLFNVLRGEMSLVGPRPPIPYEVHEYQSWHTRRLNTIPGMTGLWQVSGKNRLSFLEMVRLDIRYIRHINFLSEIKILLMTPISIVSQVYNGRERVKM